MQREKFERLATLFLAVFSTGLAVVMATEMQPAQRFGSTVAVAGSLALYLLVRAWPARAPKRIRKDD